jgi:outer membrane protein assembly factor BamB
VWRLRLPGRLAAPPTTYADACLAVCTTDLGGSLVALDPATGRRRFEVPLDATPVGGAIPFAGLLAGAGRVAGDVVVAAVDPAGRMAWEDAPPLGNGPPALAAHASGLLAATPDGACVALDRRGDTCWSRPPVHPGAPRSGPLRW